MIPIIPHKHSYSFIYATQDHARSSRLTLCRQFLGCLQFQLLRTHLSQLLRIQNYFDCVTHSLAVIWLLIDNNLLFLLLDLLLDHFARIGVRVAVLTLIVLYHHLYTLLSLFTSICKSFSWYNILLQIRLLKLQTLFHLHVLPCANLEGIFFARIEIDDYWFFELGLAVALNIHKYI